jgi:hypothetical protein
MEFHFDLSLYEFIVLLRTTTAVSDLLKVARQWRILRGSAGIIEGFCNATAVRFSGSSNEPVYSPYNNKDWGE